MEEKPMTRAEVREMLKRSREGLAWVRETLAQNDVELMREALIEAAGAIANIQDAIDERYGRGIEGVWVPESEEEVAKVTVTFVSIGGDPVVHKAGCAHLKQKAARSSDVEYNLDVATAQEAANDFWSDFLDSGEMDEVEALGATKFAPCLKSLK